MHVIAAKATAFKLAMTPEFKERQARTLSGAKILAERLTQQDVVDAGISVRSGGTDVHLVLVDLRNAAIDGKQAEDLLAEAQASDEGPGKIAAIARAESRLKVVKR